MQDLQTENILKKMKIFKFFLPFIASLLPAHSKFVLPETDVSADSKSKSLSESSNPFSQIILRKLDDAGRFLRFAKHGSHGSHGSHTSHASGNHYSHGDHYSHTSHVSGSYTNSYGSSSGTSGSGSSGVLSGGSASSKNSRNANRSSSSAKSTANVQAAKVKKVILTGNAVSDTEIRISWNCENIGNGQVTFFQNGKKIDSSSTTVAVVHLFQNLKPETSYSFYVQVTESSTGKTYKSNTITLKTFADPYIYDRNSLGLDYARLEKLLSKTVDSIIESSHLAKEDEKSLLVTDISCKESPYNAVGREVSKNLVEAFKQKNIFTIKNDKEIQETLKKSSAATNYKIAAKFAETANADLVCYGQMDKTENGYKIKLTLFDVKAENILTVKEVYYEDEKTVRTLNL